VSAGSVAAVTPLRRARVRIRPSGYIVGALCLALCTFALLPIVFAMLASVKSAPEAAAVPPLYFPSGFSLQSYQKLWNFQLGLPTYLLNSFGTAFLTIAMALGLTVPAAYGLARFAGLGPQGVFIAIAISESTLAVVSMVVFRRGKWKQQKI